MGHKMPDTEQTAGRRHGKSHWLSRLSPRSAEASEQKQQAPATKGGAAAGGTCPPARFLLDPGYMTFRYLMDALTHPSRALQEVFQKPY